MTARRTLTLLAALLCLFVPITGAHAKGKVVTDPAKITSRTPVADLRATVASRKTPRAVRQKILRVATFRKSIQRRRAVRAGCAGPVIHTVTAKLYGVVTIASRQVVQHEWCWDSRRITSHSAGRAYTYAAGGYCWGSESFTNEPWAGHPAWEYKIASVGTLHTQVPFLGSGGCGWPLDQRRFNVTLFYRVGGKVNCGRGNKPCSGR